MKNKDYALAKIESLKREIQRMQNEEEIGYAIGDGLYDELHDIYLFINRTL